jgi:hypothetical protein
MRVVWSKPLRVIALAAVAGACFVSSARADSPFALRLGMYGAVDYESRILADNKGFVVGAQYTLSGVPAILNGESWSTVLAVDYMHQFSDNARFQGIPVSINQIYTFEEQSGKTPYLGFCLSAVTYKSDLTVPEQPWVTRIGGGLIVGLNLNDKMFVEGRYEMYNKVKAAGVPEGFRALFGYRF